MLAAKTIPFAGCTIRQILEDQTDPRMVEEVGFEPT